MKIGLIFLMMNFFVPDPPDEIVDDMVISEWPDDFDELEIIEQLPDRQALPPQKNFDEDQDEFSQPDKPKITTCHRHEGETFDEFFDRARMLVESVSVRI